MALTALAPIPPNPRSASSSWLMAPTSGAPAMKLKSHTSTQSVTMMGTRTTRPLAKSRFHVAIGAPFVTLPNQRCYCWARDDTSERRARPGRSGERATPVSHAERGSHRKERVLTALGGPTVEVRQSPVAVGDVLIDGVVGRQVELGRFADAHQHLDLEVGAVLGSQRTGVLDHRGVVAPDA